MFDNLYHQYNPAAQNGALSDEPWRKPIYTPKYRGVPMQAPVAKCGKHCIDKPCERSDCPLGE